VLYPNQIRLSRSLRKSIRSKFNKGYEIRFDTDFSAVVKSCAAPRTQSGGTWITNEMFLAYVELHKMGIAHSVEVWNDKNKLVGGLYGISTGGVFSGESMFSKERDVSKVAFAALAWHMNDWGYSLIDCQIENPHLMSMGAINIPRKDYLAVLKTTKFFKQSDWVYNADCDLSHWQPNK
jgi:leucyl/phenylalanyl-tRNA--protein transferase